MRSGPDAKQVSRLLAQRIVALCAELLGAGKRIGAEWVVGSVANEPGSSMAVHLVGEKSGVWMDFASGEAGDALDLVAAVLYRGDKKLAYAWALRWLGLSSRDAAPTTRAYVPDKPDSGAEAEATRKRRSALAIWLEASPALHRTPAGDYLLGRRIDFVALGRQPRALRYHPSLWCQEVRTRLPALVAAIVDAQGQTIAVHRTWLAMDRGAWRKARLVDAKKTLGSPRGGAVRLWRGASGKPLAEAPEGETVLIGEGLETCLSAVVGCPEARVLCAVSLPNMASIALRPDLRIIILADNDGAKPAAAWGLQRVANALLDRGHEVRIARSPVGKDFNDALCQLPRQSSASSRQSSESAVHAE